MSFDKNCFYCTKEQKLNDLMIEICKLQKSTLFLFKDQNHVGRCIVAYEKHCNEIFLMDKADYALFMEDVANAAEAIFKAFNPGKINYAAYGDLVPHVHFHLVPKYPDGFLWGKPFELNSPDKKILSDKEYSLLIEKIKSNLKK